MITEISVSSESITELNVGNQAKRGKQGPRVWIGVQTTSSNIDIYLDKDQLNYLIKDLQKHKKELK